MSDEPQVTRVADLVSYQGGARHVACWRSSARLGPVSVRGVRQAAVGECGPDEDTKLPVTTRRSSQRVTPLTDRPRACGRSRSSSSVGPYQASPR